MNCYLKIIERLKIHYTINTSLTYFEVEELLSQLSKINLDINFYDKKILRKISKEDFDKLFFKE